MEAARPFPRRIGCIPEPAETFFLEKGLGFGGWIIVRKSNRCSDMLLWIFFAQRQRRCRHSGHCRYRWLCPRWLAGLRAVPPPSPTVAVGGSATGSSMLCDVAGGDAHDMILVPHPAADFYSFLLWPPFRGVLAELDAQCRLGQFFFSQSTCLSCRVVGWVHLGSFSFFFYTREPVNKRGQGDIPVWNKPE